MSSKRESNPPWAGISRDLQAGAGLEVFSEGEEDSPSAGFLELLTPHLPTEKRLDVLIGDVWVGLFELPDGGESRFDFFPGDELVRVLVGKVTLTDAASGEVQVFSEDEFFFVPKGWRGLWSCDGRNLELAVCSRDWLPPYERAFRGETLDAQRRSKYVAIDTGWVAELAGSGSEDTSGIRRALIQGTDLVIEAVTAAEGTVAAPFAGEGDAFMQVLTGAVTLESDDGGHEAFAPGDCFAVSGAFDGSWSFGRGYAGLLVRANRQDVR